MLAELAKHPGRVLAHAHLLRTVWGPAQERQTDYLRVAIRALRQKLERDPGPARNHHQRAGCRLSPGQPRGLKPKRRCRRAGFRRTGRGCGPWSATACRSWCAAGCAAAPARPRRYAGDRADALADLVAQPAALLGVGDAAMDEHRGRFLARRPGDRERGDVAGLEAGQLLDRPFDVLRPVVPAVDDDHVLGAADDENVAARTCSPCRRCRANRRRSGRRAVASASRK